MELKLVQLTVGGAFYILSLAETTVEAAAALLFESDIDEETPIEEWSLTPISSERASNLFLTDEDTGEKISLLSLHEATEFPFVQSCSEW
jgi:hypothetical protein